MVAADTSIDIPNSVTSVKNWITVYYGVCHEYVTEIEVGILENCKALKSIKLHHTEPIPIDFPKKIKETCVLYVPAGTRWAYRHHYSYRDFARIETFNEE